MVCIHKNTSVSEGDFSSLDSFLPSLVPLNPILALKASGRFTLTEIRPLAFQYNI